METGVFAMFPLRLQPHSAARGSLLDHRRRHGQIADHGDRTSHTFQPIQKSAVVVILIPKVEDEQNDQRGDKDAHFISLLPSAPGAKMCVRPRPYQYPFQSAAGLATARSERLRAGPR